MGTLPYFHTPTPPHSARHRLRLAGLRLIGRLYPRPRPPSTAPRSLLLIRPDHLGDVLFLTPALHALRERLAETKVTLLVGPWGQAAIAGNPDVDAVVVCPFPGFERRERRGGFSAVTTDGAGKQGLWATTSRASVRENPPLRIAPYRLLFATARQLHGGGYDAAVILRFDHWWGAWLAAAAGIPWRIGYAWPETQPFLTQAVHYRADRHEVVQNAGLLAVVDAQPAQAGFASVAAVSNRRETLGPTRFVVPPADREWAAGWLAARDVVFARPLVAIHPGAGAEVKQWPAAAWAATANRLAAELGATILLTGAEAERSLTAVIAAQLDAPALDAAGQTTLGQLAALYERCALVLGADSGPLHLAVAAGAPTVHLYGPIDPAKFGPWGDPTCHAILTTPWPCAPCNRLDWPVDTLSQHACMTAIGVEDVVRRACSVLRVACCVIR